MPGLPFDAPGKLEFKQHREHQSPVTGQADQLINRDRRGAEVFKQDAARFLKLRFVGQCGEFIFEIVAGGSASVSRHAVDMRKYRPLFRSAPRPGGSVVGSRAARIERRARHREHFAPLLSAIAR